MLRERTKDALLALENYFCAVAEEEAHGNVVPSRTEELYHAAKGLKAVTMCKYKHWLKEHTESMTEEEDTATTTVMAETATMSNPMRYKH